MQVLLVTVYFCSDEDNKLKKKQRPFKLVYYMYCFIEGYIISDYFVLI